MTRMRQFSSRLFYQLAKNEKECRTSCRLWSWVYSWTGALPLFSKGLVGLFDGILFESSGLHEEAVFLSERIALLKGEITVSLFGEAFFAKGVCSEKTISTGVPESGVIVVWRVIHHSNCDVLIGAVGAIVADPASTLTPGIFVDLTLRVGDVALCDLTFVP